MESIPLEKDQHPGQTKKSHHTLLSVSNLRSWLINRKEMKSWLKWSNKILSFKKYYIKKHWERTEQNSITPSLGFQNALAVKVV